MDKVNKLELRRLAEEECISSELGCFDNPQLCAAILSLLDELEQYRKDAERYRWLRDKHNEANGDTWVSVWSGEWKSLDSHILPDFDGDLDLDKAVDAATAKEGGANG